MLPVDFWAKWKEILLVNSCHPITNGRRGHPETITADLAQSLAAAGVNRVSLGVQLLTESLHTLERRHDLSLFRERLKFFARQQLIGFPWI